MLKTRSVLAVAAASLAISAALVFPGLKPKIVRAQMYGAGWTCSTYGGNGCYGCGAGGSSSSPAGYGCQSPVPPVGTRFGQCVQSPGSGGCRNYPAGQNCGNYVSCVAPNTVVGKCSLQALCT